jgi:NADP-dependent 3-hydroxy acid dehydrogenase YdfG
MTRELTGSVAIVTGASSGIGHATARSLAEQGATVILVARRQDRLDALVTEIENVGGTAFAMATDISDRAQAEAAIGKTIEQFGRLDILVNDAGLMILGSFAHSDVDDFERMIDINQKGLLYLTKAALPHLQKAANESHVRVGVLEPGAVSTELVSHNTPDIQATSTFPEDEEALQPEDIANGITYIVTRPRHMSISEIWIMPTDQV